ncbi:eukaryotic translation initiation factor 2 subunit alpha [Pyrenophora seminiperda CCB06]|uniref:Eukaryotic translation initiation factor 2 subunit alpha n=1 Tax=Pyrenophora seminiperda CCB06 TaxID=1302712 RepID=A0A3M7MBK4_9PLEO|nr:eukaryotic translation initiation factor 2 subunit alpha [Pyrenophora seminiperda CCB06]
MKRRPAAVMMLFKTLVAATALFNVALSSTDFSSAVGPVTSVQWLTSITILTGTATATVPSNSSCVLQSTTTITPTVTVTQGASTSLASDIVPTPSAPGMTSLVPTEKTPMNSMTIVTSLYNQSSSYCTVNSTVMPSSMASMTMSIPYPMNSTTAAVTGTGTGTGYASASEPASASSSAPAEFTAAAGVVNMGTAALFGGIAMAFFGA